MALQAKLDEGGKTLESSGLPAFERMLETFLAEEKASTLLVTILDDLTPILSDAADGDEISVLRARAHAVQEGLLSGSLTIAPSSMLELLTPHPASGGIKKVVEAAPTQGLRETRAYPVCGSMSRAAFDFFVSFENNLVKEAQARSELASLRWLCNLHSWQFQNVAALQDISVGHVPLVEMVAASLTEIANSNRHLEAANYLLSKHEHCPACEALKKEQDSQAARFLEYISTPDGQKFYRQSLGLCPPHLRAVLALQPSEEIVNFLLNEQAEHFNDLATTYAVTCSNVTPYVAA